MEGLLSTGPTPSSFFNWHLVYKGLEGVEVGVKNLSFSVLKHKPKVRVDAIFCMILTTLLSIYQYTLFFQPNLSEIKCSKKSNFGRFYGVTQGHLS